MHDILLNFFFSEVKQLEVIFGTVYDRDREIQIKKITFLEFFGTEVTYSSRNTLRCHY